MIESDGSGLFTQPLRETPWTTEDHAQPTTCNQCGNSWHPWAGSYLPCHLKCWLTEKGWQYAEDHEHLSNKQFAAEFGIEDRMSLVQSIRKVIDRRRR